jgi:CRISPR/Cas system CSM-associated protein Csm4 (group 5 of RAMP superfamily)
MIMKKNVMLAALMLVSTIIFAQRKPHHDNKKGHERHEEHLKKSLLLTDDQYTKVKSINENFAKQFSTIRKDTAMTQGTARTQTKKLREDHKAQMRTVLNEPQWAKWKEMHTRRKGKKPTYDHNRGRGDARPRHDQRG